MFFQQLYLGCLAQASYLVGSNGDAAVVDPRRDVDEYIAIAGANGFTIRYVIETHLHADFVSGHRELAERTGASIVMAAAAHAAFPHIGVSEGDRLRIGDVLLHIIATPGHTPESICVLLEEAGRPVKVLTGDTLFIGDVGRPDLAAGSGFSAEQMAALMYDSLHGKLLRLADDVEVWPGHGAGSLCGRSLSPETSSTIGVQRRVNYALQPMPKDAFVAMMTAELVEMPRYFPRDAQINRSGARPLRDVPAPAPLRPEDARSAIERGATVLDVRRPASFGSGHIARSLNIALDGQFASWAGTLIAPDAEVVVVGDRPAEAEQAVMRLARVGLENVRGRIDGGVESWRRSGLAVKTTQQTAVRELRQMMIDGPRLQLVDVRRSGEFRDAHAEGAVNLPLHELAERAAALDPADPVAVICASGYRSSIGASILEREGFAGVLNVVGGTSAWLQAGLPVRKLA